MKKGKSKKSAPSKKMAKFRKSVAKKRKVGNGTGRKPPGKKK